MLRRERMTPEGLFGGVQRTTAVFSLMAAEKASRSIWKSSGFEGTAVSIAARGLGVELVLREIRAERQHLIARREQRIGQHRQRRGCAGGHIQYPPRGSRRRTPSRDTPPSSRGRTQRPARGRINVQLLGRGRSAAGARSSAGRRTAPGRKGLPMVKLNTFFRADDGGAAAVGGEIPDDAALAAPGDHFFTDHIAYPLQFDSLKTPIRRL